MAKNAELLSFSLMFIVAGLAGWFLLPLLKSKIDETKLPKKLIFFVFRFVGSLLVLASIFTTHFSLRNLILLLVGLLPLIFTNFIFRSVYIYGSKENRLMGRILSICVISLGIFMLLAALFPSHMPKIHRVDNGISRENR